jgi:hypothetical protein
VRSTLVIAALSAALLVSALWQPRDDGFVWCVFRRVTGLECGSCGMTRAVCALSRGELGVAMEYNVAAPLVYALALAAIAAAAAELVTGIALFEPLLRRTHPWLLRCVLIAYATAWIFNLRSA